MHSITVEKPKAKFRVTIGKRVEWATSEGSANAFGPGAKIEKQLGKYKVTCKLPSGKLDVRWLNSFTAITQFAAEYGIGPSYIKWVHMR